jgi:hypothetical protein
MGFFPLDIQGILHWHSQAFMAYLRNVAILAIHQFENHNRAAKLPILECPAWYASPFPALCFIFFFWFYLPAILRYLWASNLFFLDTQPLGGSDNH